MKNKIALVDSRMEKFRDLVSHGIMAWIDAGKLLCEIVDDNPDAYTEILSNNPSLTREILESFERIGRKELYPYLLVDGSPGARRLASLPYDSQVKLFEAKLPVLVKVNGQFEERRKKVCELSKTEAALVFDVNRVRTVKEQFELLKKPQITAVVKHSNLSPKERLGTAFVALYNEFILSRSLTVKEAKCLFEEFFTNTKR